jgi:uncharacterized protein YuzE
MNTAYLEVTYREGKPIAAYYYLPRPEEQRSVRTRRVEAGLLIDFAKDGRPIGIEITAIRAVGGDVQSRAPRPGFSAC